METAPRLLYNGGGRINPAFFPYSSGFFRQPSECINGFTAVSHRVLPGLSLTKGNSHTADSPIALSSGFEFYLSENIL